MYKMYVFSVTMWTFGILALLVFMSLEAFYNVKAKSVSTVNQSLRIYRVIKTNIRGETYSDRIIGHSNSTLASVYKVKCSDLKTIKTGRESE